MQIGDIIGVILAGLVMFFPLYILHNSDLASNPATGGFGGPNLPAPQAGLMAALSQGIVGGEMAWPLVLVGIALGISLILIRVKSPMLFSVGMYLPLETTFAIFIGGLIRGLVDRMSARRKNNDAQKARVENAGVLTASGLIAGEALMGLFIATVAFIKDQMGGEAKFWTVGGFETIAPWLALPILLSLHSISFTFLFQKRESGRTSTSHRDNVKWVREDSGGRSDSSPASVLRDDIGVVLICYDHIEKGCRYVKCN